MAEWQAAARAEPRRLRLPAPPRSRIGECSTSAIHRRAAVTARLVLLVLREQADELVARTLQRLQIPGRDCTFTVSDELIGLSTLRHQGPLLLQMLEVPDPPARLRQEQGEADVVQLLNLLTQQTRITGLDGRFE